MEDDDLVQQRTDFLDHIHVMVDYWMNLEPRQIPEGETELSWKMNGLAFSMLVALDGGAGGLPGYEVKPLYNQYGEEYTDVMPSPDIAGSLHEQWHHKE